MANVCGFDMKIKGEPEKVQELLSILQNKDETKPYFYRSSKPFILDDTELADGTLKIAGDCAWNTESCLTQTTDDTCYQEDVAAGTHTHGTTMEIETKRLGLSVEWYSAGDGFEEHILIENGEVKVNEHRHTDSFLTDEYESVEDLNHQAQRKFTQEEFEENEILEVGGFDEWVYSI